LHIFSQHAAEMKVAEDRIAIGKLSLGILKCINQTPSLAL